MGRTGYIEPDTRLSFQIDDTSSTTRIDKVITAEFPLYSRNFFQKLIEDEHVKVNGTGIKKYNRVVKPGDTIEIHFPPEPSIDKQTVLERDLDVRVLAKEHHFLIIEKPANLLVHKTSARSTAVTLVDWIVTHYDEIRHVGYIDRPGIVHRLDKDTSGLLIVPRTNYAHNLFSDMFKERTIKKTYLAVVHGHPDRAGTIELAIGRDKRHKVKMTTHAQADPEASIRHATTHYEVLEYFDEYSLVCVKPVTGRTHQIRVHFSAIGHPLIGDPVYGRKSGKFFERQALHAHALAFNFDGTSYHFTCEPPSDFKKLVKTLQKKS